MKIVLAVIFLIGLVYLLMPSAGSIQAFPAIPGSLKSNEPGDTYQNLNNAAYFSDQRRAEVLKFYQDFYSLKIFGLTIPPIHLIQPPESAYQYVRDQQMSSGLDELTYPLRDSIFINNWEPYSVSGKRFNTQAMPVFIEGSFYANKSTLRYYSSNLALRVAVYLGIWGLGFWLIKLFLKSLKK